MELDKIKKGLGAIWVLANVLLFDTESQNKIVLTELNKYIRKVKTMNIWRDMLRGIFSRPLICYKSWVIKAWINLD